MSISIHFVGKDPQDILFIKQAYARFKQIIPLAVTVLNIKHLTHFNHLNKTKLWGIVDHKFCLIVGHLIFRLLTTLITAHTKGIKHIQGQPFR